MESTLPNGSVTVMDPRALSSGADEASENTQNGSMNKRVTAAGRLSRNVGGHRNVLPPSTARPRRSRS